ncbi:MAG: helix-turn-helix domain-containing protein [Bacillota bacterium]
MRQGTPGFVGERLREAREARGVQASDLASQLGVSRQAISQYENGGVSPHPEVMRRIANILDLPVRYFCQAPRTDLGTTLFYRSLARATSTARKKSTARFNWLVDITNWVTRYVDLPAVNLPQIDVPADPALISTDDVERAAEICRKHWGIGDGPLPNVVRLLERSGVVVARGAVSEDIDAFSTWVSDRPYVFLGKDKSAARGRFNALHELGHLVLHRRVEQGLANRHEIHSLLESQAHRFAGALALPAQAFAADLRGSTMPYFQALKPKWVMSIGSMIYRAADLCLINQEQVQRLWKQRARLGWRDSEPWDDEIPVEEPFLLRRSIELILREAIISKEDILAEISLGAADVEDLVGLPPGFFAATSEAASGGGKIIPFSRRQNRSR